MPERQTGTNGLLFAAYLHVTGVVGLIQSYPQRQLVNNDLLVECPVSGYVFRFSGGLASLADQADISIEQNVGLSEGGNMIVDQDVASHVVDSWACGYSGNVLQGHPD